MVEDMMIGQIGFTQTKPIKQKTMSHQCLLLFITGSNQICDEGL